MSPMLLPVRKSGRPDPEPDPPEPDELSLLTGNRLLWAVFGIILLVMIAGTSYIASSLGETYTKSEQFMHGFRDRERLLDDLRNTILRSDSILMDYLGAEANPELELDRRSLMEQKEQGERVMARYAELQSADEISDQQVLHDLDTAVELYWARVAPVLGWDQSRLSREGPTYREGVLAAARGEVFRLERELTVLNDQRLDSGEARITADQQRLHSHLLLTTVLELVLAVALALVVTMRTERLKAAARQQYGSAMQARAQLRKLTGRIESAQEDERRRISRELHDEVGQSMAAMLVGLARVEQSLKENDGASAELAQVREQAERSLRSVRDIALLLRPSMLDDLGLVPALNWQCREVARRTGLSIRFDADENGAPIPDEYKTNLYRVMQEALNNVVKHASAKSVRVSFQQSRVGMDLRIEDDGVGFDPARDRGLGLLGMQERITRLNGRLHISSGKGRGTQLNIHLPPGEENGAR